MANKALFNKRATAVKPTDHVNEAGGTAYAMTAKHALAQFATTGTLSDQHYTKAEKQLEQVLEFASQVDATFVAKTALYARVTGGMKDMPALLCVHLASRKTPEARKLLKAIFPVVIDNGKMLRNFVQILRSGVTGRKSLGSTAKKLIQHWLLSRNYQQLLYAYVGNDPSLADIIKLARPRVGEDTVRQAFHNWVLGREFDADALPLIVLQYEQWKRGEGTGPVPTVPFQLLDSLPLTTEHWKDIFRNGRWQFTRMNLNTAQRHGVFDDPAMVKLIADRLRDPKQIEGARAFPYQLLGAYLAVTNDVGGGMWGSEPDKREAKDMPREIVDALHDALEIATENVPDFGGTVYVFPDVSGSMNQAITGNRKGSTSKVKCYHVSALIAATVLRRNPGSRVIPFSDNAFMNVNLEPRDTVMTNARAISRLGGGGTNTSDPLRQLNEKNAKGDLCIWVSDLQSWVDSDPSGYGYGYNSRGRGTPTMDEWEIFRKRNPNAKAVHINVQAYNSVQAHDRKDILNIGGFSDKIFETISQFAKGALNPEHWVGEIEGTQVPAIVG